MISDANDWEARFETVKNTFSSRVGQISNAAFDNSVIAYNENSTSEEQKKCRELLEKIIKPADAVKYAVALGKRGFMWDVLIDCVSKNALKVRREDL